MTRIRFLPDGREVVANEGETILAASLRQGIPHANACGGQGLCSTCRVLVLHASSPAAARNSLEQAIAEKMGFSPEVRLACQLKPEGDVILKRLVLDETDLELVQETLSGPIRGLAGEAKDVAVLFTDIRSFTAFSENLPPYDVIHVLQRYFRQMSDVVHAEGGVVNNFTGDGLLALFGVDGQTEPSLRAVRAGLAMLSALDRLAPYFLSAYGRALQMGVGIHYGPVVLGRIGVGGEERLSAIGSTVNLASRIESANKLEKTHLLVSETVFRQVEAYVRTGRVVTAVLPGKAGSHALREILGVRDPGG